jgi:hypothetical protein
MQSMIQRTIIIQQKSLLDHAEENKGYVFKHGMQKAINAYFERLGSQT